MKATEVTAGLAESNGSLLPGLWRDSLHVTCGLTACTPGSAPGPTLGNEYGKTLPFYCSYIFNVFVGLLVTKLRKADCWVCTASASCGKTGPGYRRQRILKGHWPQGPRDSTSTSCWVRHDVIWSWHSLSYVRPSVPQTGSSTWSTRE